MKRNSRLATPLAIALALAGVGSTGLAADYPTTVNALGPVLYYRLNTTNQVPSEVKAANLGALGAAFNGDYQYMANTRGVAGAITGDADTAVTIVGSTGSQVLTPYSEANNPNGPFTVEFWAKPNTGSTASGNHTAAISMVNGQNAANGDDRTGWAVRHVGPDWQVLLGDDHSDGATFYHTQMFAPGTAAEGVWQHVVMVYTPERVSIYVNGVEAAGETPVKPLMPNRFAPLILGDRGYTGWDFDGQLDEFALYPSALTADEIKAHYDNAKNANRTTPYPTLVLQKNPTVYYRLGEASLQLPVAVNTGSLGAAANGTYKAGTTPGVPALQTPAATGFEATNTAVGIDGASGTITIPGISLNTDTVTMVCWLKRDGAQPARAGIMHNRKVSEPQVKATGLGFQDDGLALSYNWEDVGETYTFNPNFVPPDKTWTFYAVTISPYEQTMYMGTASGLVSATNTWTISPHDFSGTTLELGWDNYQTTRVFRGALDEFAMFDKTLTFDEVKSLYDAARPSILAVTRTPADPVYEGSDMTLQAAVAGTAPITYQWRKDGSAISGATSVSYTKNNVGLGDSGNYDVVVTTGGKTLTSGADAVTVVSSPPIIATAPVSTVRFVNGNVSFSVGTRGSQPMSYQWKHEGQVLPGATSATVQLTDLQPADAGTYTVVVSNPYGTNEASATLTLATPSKYTAAAVDLGPIGYWRLEETAGPLAFDYWGARDGYHTNGVAPDKEGPRPTTANGFDAANKAYEFNGNASAVVIPPLNLNKATMTIVAWIKPNGDQVDFAGIVFARGSTASGLDLTTEDQLGYHWNDAGDTHGFRSGLVPTDATWNFVAMVVQPDLATFYLDNGTGMLAADNPVTHGPAAFADPLRIGVDSPGGGRGFKGLIDEVTVFDRALTSAEVTKLKTAGFAGTYAPTPVTFTQQPKGQTIMVGSSYTLSARVSGSVPITYQWQKDGVNIPGAIRSSLTFNAATEADSGTYKLVVTQGATTVNSSAATLVVKPVPTYINLPENLVAHYKFDGNYQDSSGRNNNGEAKGTPTIITGKIGSGAVRVNTEVADGSVTAANYVTLNTPADLKFGTSSFTLAFWTKVIGSPGDLPFICNNTSSYGGEGYTFAPSWETGSWSWSFNDASNMADWPGYAAQYGNEVGYADALNDGAWHHLVFIADRSDEMAVYLDGQKAHAKSLAGLNFNLDTANTVDIGQAGGAYTVAGTLEIDDMGIWRRVLTEYDAQAIYIVGNNYGRSFDEQAPPEIKVEIKPAAGNTLQISWTTGTLEATSDLKGTWAPVPGANPPTFTVTPGTTATSVFYRVRQ